MKQNLVVFSRDQRPLRIPNLTIKGINQLKFNVLKQSELSPLPFGYAIYMFVPPFSDILSQFYMSDGKKTRSQHSFLSLFVVSAHLNSEWRKGTRSRTPSYVLAYHCSCTWTQTVNSLGIAKPWLFWEHQPLFNAWLF